MASLSFLERYEMAADARPPFDPDLFVNHDQALREIEQRAQELVAAGADSGRFQRRLLRVKGAVGLGKSWLMCRAQEQIHEKVGGVLVYRLCLVDDAASLRLGQPWEKTFPAGPAAGALSPAELASETLKWLIRCTVEARGALALGLNLPADLQELEDRLERELRATGRPCVLLVDGLDELPPPPIPGEPGAVRLLADFWLIPLIRRRGVFVVLAARNPPAEAVQTDLYRPEISTYAYDIDLRPFTQPDIEKQLELAATRADVTGVPLKAAEQAAEILATGGGSPLANLRLAQKLDPVTAEWPDPGQVALESVDGYLAGLPVDLRDCFFAVCVFREFDIWRLQESFVAYGIPGEDWQTYLGATEVMRRLGDSRLVDMNHEQRHYPVIQDPFWRVLNRALHVTDHERWQTLHTRAADLYGKWAEKNSRESQRWQSEAAYHRACLDRDAVLPWDWSPT